MRTLLSLLTIIGAVLLSIQIRQDILASYHYEKSYSQLWSLADKSSTIPAKKEYIEKFLNALREGKKNGDFADYNAIFLKTPNNSFESNLKALETLSGRLAEIQNMNPSSFEYNTAQEQGEANAMLSEFEGCYRINNYMFVWNWVGFTTTVVSLVLLIVSGMSLFIYITENGFRNRW